MLVAILGDRRSTLPMDWAKETTVAVAADVSLDASGASPGASLTYVGIASDLDIRVPPGSRVKESGFSLVGDREINVSPGEGPDISIKVYGFFNDVKVTDQPLGKG